MPIAPKTKKEKIKLAAHLAAQSDSAKEFFELTEDKWEQFLTLWDEEAVDDFLLILNEESVMLSDSAKTAARKHQVNETRLKQRLVKIEADAKNLIKNKDE